MAASELNVSIFSDVVLLELYLIKGKRRILERKHYEKYSLPLVDMTKVDVLDIERFINTFLERGTRKRGVVNIFVFGDMGIDVFHELTVKVTKPSLVKRALPLQIEQNIGKEYLGNASYRYEQLGESLKLFFMRKNVVDYLSQVRLYGNFELNTLLPGSLTYMGLIPDDGAVLEIGRESFALYGFRGGYLSSVSNDSIPYSYTLDPVVNPSKQELFEIVRDDALTMLSNFNFSSETDVDTVTVVFTNEVHGDFESVEYDDVVFDGIRDLRNWLEVDPGDYVGDDTRDALAYSASSLGYFYLGDNVRKFDFSPEKLSYAYRNLMIGSLLFSLLTVGSLTGTSYLIENQLVESRESVVTYGQTLANSEKGLADVVVQIGEHDKKIDDYNAYVSSLERLSALDRNFVSGVLGYLPENTPKSIVVNEVTLTKGTKNLVLSGVSSTYKDIGAFAIELEEFGKVDIRDIRENVLLNKEGYPFEIELRSN